MRDNWRDAQAEPSHPEVTVLLERILRKSPPCARAWRRYPARRRRSHPAATPPSGTASLMRRAGASAAPVDAAVPTHGMVLAPGTEHERGRKTRCEGESDVTQKKYGPKASERVESALHEMKRGRLRSGGSGRKVESREQAIAIGL